MTYSELGNLYRRRGRYDDALQAIAAGIQIAPHPALYHNLAMALIAKIQDEGRRGDEAGVRRDIVAARQALEHALELGNASPESYVFRQQWDPAKTHALLAQVLLSMGDRAGARSHLETALRLEPEGPIADLTRRYMHMQKLDQ